MGAATCQKGKNILGSIYIYSLPIVYKAAASCRSYCSLNVLPRQGGGGRGVSPFFRPLLRRLNYLYYYCCCVPEFFPPAKNQRQKHPCTIGTDATFRNKTSTLPPHTFDADGMLRYHHSKTRRGVASFAATSVVHHSLPQKLFRYKPEEKQSQRFVYRA